LNSPRKSKNPESSYRRRPVFRRRCPKWMLRVRWSVAASNSVLCWSITWKADENNHVV
jgi:hypothetical protein